MIFRGPRSRMPVYTVKYGWYLFSYFVESMHDGLSKLVYTRTRLNILKTAIGVPGCVGGVHASSGAQRSALTSHQLGDTRSAECGGS